MRISDWSSDVCSSDLEWYLFPNDVATVSPSGYGDVQTYIDALLAPARALGKDRHFTYITSIAEEDAYYTSGASAGFGVRLAYDPFAQVVVIAEAYEGAPALTAGIDRSGRISAIGTSRSEEHTSELQSLMRHSYAVFCVKKKTQT